MRHPAMRLDPFHERLISCAATVDEILSADFESLPGQKSDSDLAARRLAAWCRGCASGDWALFARRLERDGLSLAQVLARFATVRRKDGVPPPTWLADAICIEAALQSATGEAETRGQCASKPPGREPFAFEELLAPVAAQADALLAASVDARAFGNLTPAARAQLTDALLEALSDLFAPALYERYAGARKAAPAPAAEGPRVRYDKFVRDMKAGGFRHLFEDKPVLLRLAAVVMRQWIGTSAELLTRLDADLPAICREIFGTQSASRVAAIEGDLSDLHNEGRSVRILRFEEDARVVYKPKDLRLDEAWHALVERLNRSGAPTDLKSVRALVREGYGWTEFIAHTGCADSEAGRRFFRRAGAWLALFHCFAGSDMHQENMIATGEHPVPIDLEMILQATAEEHQAQEPEAQALEAAIEIVASSVMSVGLLPAYGKSPENKVFAIGGMTSDGTARMKLAWNDINSDAMRPVKRKERDDVIPNLPHVQGRYARLGDHIEPFIAGFEDYATFLLHLTRDAQQGGLFDGFAGLPVRKVVRPTRFYYMLLQRLKNHRSMDDGIGWSAQADFLARLSDWDSADPFWPLQRAERAALVGLNVPHFVSADDGQVVSDASGASVRTWAPSGLARARQRLTRFDAPDIAWQIEVIRQNTSALSRSTGPAYQERPLLRQESDASPTRELLIARADQVAAELAAHAVRRGPGAAWIGLDWLGDSEVCHLVPLGPDLYNGTSGIALFLAAHAGITGNRISAELARAAVLRLRRNLRGHNAARLARSLGLGGATGLGSVVYAFTVMAKCLGDDDLLADAHAAAALCSDDLIAADKQLDALGGAAGCILALLRLDRDSPSADLVARAERCGEHLLAQPREGEPGRRSWKTQGTSERALNGISHGAAGFALALAALAAVSGREDFAAAARECIAFENASYDPERANWPDVRPEGRDFPCQWCHGAPGIGLARVATLRRGKLDVGLVSADIRNAVSGVEQAASQRGVDTLCCGSLGVIEFLCEAGVALGRNDLERRAERRLMAVIEAATASGGYRWPAGSARFNLGLFRGLAGVGYTLLRRADERLPNVLIWE